MPHRPPSLFEYFFLFAFVKIFKLSVILKYIFLRLYAYVQYRLNYDRGCIVFLAATLLSITPIFFYRIHADAARMARRACGVEFFGRDLGEVVRKNMLANRFLRVSLACRALGVIMTGSVGNSVHRALLDTDIFQYSLFSYRERFAATYETFFLPGAMCLALLYADGNDGLRRMIPRAYELLTRFYLRLLREPETLFQNPMPPRITRPRITRMARFARRRRH